MIRTAAYCRVSTEMEAQEGSYDIQEKYYRDLISNNSEMTLVGIYGDKGKSGLSAGKRPGLQKLLDDCREGKIDLILCKSVSRFARNMADFVEMMRELKSLGVNARFEKEGIDTKDKSSDFIIKVLAIVAEEESHSISQHCILSHVQHAQAGKPYGKIAYGYYNGGDNKWVINATEAKRVRKAFEMAIEGKPYPEIVKTLNAMEDTPFWTQKRVKNILMNLVYKGDYYSHKYVSIVPGKSVKNRSLRDRYYLNDHHEGIVSKETFERVQEILKRGLLQSHRKWTKDDIQFMKGGKQNAGRK